MARLGPAGLLDTMLKKGPSDLDFARLAAADHGIDLGPLKPCLPERLFTALSLLFLMVLLAAGGWLWRWDQLIYDLQIDFWSKPPADDIVIVDDENFKLRAERWDEGEGRIYTITYRATDACGNMGTAVQVITVEDTTAPTVTAPPDLTVDCSVDAGDPANTGGSATATDACDAAPVVTFYEDTADAVATRGEAGVVLEDLLPVGQHELPEFIRRQVKGGFTQDLLAGKAEQFTVSVVGLGNF